MELMIESIKFKRKCSETGDRALHKLYAVGGGLAHACDRLPISINECPCCGETIRFSRGIQKINFSSMFGHHVPLEGQCECPAFCIICHPPLKTHSQNFLMWVGKKWYTPESFAAEVREMGASKAIPYIPEGLEPKKSWIFCAMKGIIDEELGYHPAKKRRTIKKDAVFYAYKLERIDYLITEDEAKDDKWIANMMAKGINLVVVKDSDLEEDKENIQPRYLKTGKGRYLEEFFDGDNSKNS